MMMMKLVLDASVAVAAARAGEPSHSAANARVRALLAGPDAIVVPAIFPIEVGAALARRGEDPARIRDYVAALIAEPHEVVLLGPRRARRIMDVAIASQLRAADAAYVWLASSRGVPLITLDAEVARRGAGFCTIALP